MNKKVKNANPMQYDGIQFKSRLEVTIYKTLIEAGLHPEYESKTYLIWEGFVPTVPFYTKNTLKRKDFRCTPVGLSTIKVRKPLQGITYTPDFIFEYHGYKVIVEGKGYANDVYGYKMKMLRKYLEEQPDCDKYIVWEVFTKRQLLECINDLKTNYERTDNTSPAAVGGHSRGRQQVCKGTLRSFPSRKR